MGKLKGLEAQAVPLIIRKQSHWYSCVFRMKTRKPGKVAAVAAALVESIDRYPLRNWNEVFRLVSFKETRYQILFFHIYWAKVSGYTLFIVLWMKARKNDHNVSANITTWAHCEHFNNIWSRVSWFVTTSKNFREPRKTGFWSGFEPVWAGLRLKLILHRLSAWKLF